MQSDSGSYDTFLCQAVFMEDACSVVCALSEGRCAIVDLGGCSQELGQRVLDFILGYCYGTGGTVQKISSHLVLVFPRDAKPGDSVLDALTSYDAEAAEQYKEIRQLQDELDGCDENLS